MSRIKSRALLPAGVQMVYNEFQYSGALKPRYCNTNIDSDGGWIYGRNRCYGRQGF
jgi:hypothetical protein